MAGAKVNSKTAVKKTRPALGVIENGVRKRPVESTDKAQKKQRISAAPIEGEVERAKSPLKASLLLGLDGTTAIAEDIGRQKVTAEKHSSPKEIETAIVAVSTKEIEGVAKTYLWDKDIAVAATGRVEGPIFNEKDPIYQYWLKKMQDALNLQDKEKYTRESEKLRLLCQSVMDICERQHGCCKSCHIKMTNQKIGGNWRNATADRIVPHANGGKFSIASNIQILCVGCNMMKHYHTEKAAAKLTQYVGQTALATRDSDGLFFDNQLPTDVKEPTKDELDRLITSWYKDKLIKMRISSKRKVKKNVQVSLEHLLKLVKSRWIGNGEIQDAAGVRAGIKLMDLDRIDSKLGYIEGNIRILLHGLNSLKRDYPSDDRLYEYIQHLRSVWKSIEVVFGAWLPWSSERQIV